MPVEVSVLSLSLTWSFLAGGIQGSLQGDVTSRLPAVITVASAFVMRASSFGKMVGLEFGGQHMTRSWAESA
jgi:hypothetical protein